MPYTADFVPETLTRADVDATRGPLVLEFGTSWCGWCRGAQPHVRAAFEQARAAIRQRELKEGYEPSNPQLFVGKAMRARLARSAVAQLSADGR